MYQRGGRLSRGRCEICLASRPKGKTNMLGGSYRNETTRSSIVKDGHTIRTASSNPQVVRKEVSPIGGEMPSRSPLSSHPRPCNVDVLHLNLQEIITRLALNDNGNGPLFSVHFARIGPYRCRLEPTSLSPSHCNLSEPFVKRFFSFFSAPLGGSVLLSTRRR